VVDVVHRTTKEYRRSVNDPDFPTGTWIHSPDLSAVNGFDSKYWTITGDVVSLMSQGERDAVDAAELTSRGDTIAALIEVAQSYEKAFAEILLDEFNGHATKINAILTAIDNGATLANVKTNIAAITDYPSRSLAQLRTALRSKLST